MPASSCRASIVADPGGQEMEEQTAANEKQALIKAHDAANQKNQADAEQCFGPTQSLNCGPNLYRIKHR